MLDSIYKKAASYHDIMNILANTITCDISKNCLQDINEEPEGVFLKQSDFLSKLYSTNEDLLALAYNGFGKLEYLPFPSDLYAFDIDYDEEEVYCDEYKWTGLKFIQKSDLTECEIDILHCCCFGNLFHESDSKITLNKNVTLDDMRSWAKRSWWSYSEAISRIVSSRHSNIQAMKLEASSILKKVEQGESKYTIQICENRNGLFVSSFEWLQWCKGEGFEAPEMLWSSVNRQELNRKLIAFCGPTKGLSSADIDDILVIDETLQQYELLDKCYKYLSSLNQNGWNSNTANQICAAIRQEGTLLMVIEEKKSQPYLSQSDFDIRKPAINKTYEAIEKINQFLKGEDETQSKKGLDIFKNMTNLTCSELTIRLLRKDEKSMPEMVKVEARGNKRTVSCDSLNLISKKDRQMNRAGKTLFAMTKHRSPQDVIALDQAMKDLRKIIRSIGIIDKNPFIKAGQLWEPRFTLIDAIEKADKRAAERAVHIQYDDTHPYERESDTAEEWLQENDK